MSSEPALQDAPDNLFKPIEGELGAHGRFDTQELPSVDMRSPVLPSWFDFHGFKMFRPHPDVSMPHSELLDGGDGRFASPCVDRPKLA